MLMVKWVIGVGVKVVVFSCEGFCGEVEVYVVG